MLNLSALFYTEVEFEPCLFGNLNLRDDDRKGIAEEASRGNAGALAFADVIPLAISGTLVSALSLGIANKLTEPLAGAVLAKILILCLLILFIQWRPRGLFALKGRAVDA